MKRLLILTLFSAVIFCGCRTTGPTRVSPGAPLKAEKSSTAGELLAGDISFDRVTGKIRYTLPEAGLVRIRIGLDRGGPMLRNLLDWQRREAGVHEEIWDKKDASGQVDFSKHKNLQLVISCLPADRAKRAKYKGIIKGFRQSPRMTITLPEWTGEGTPVVRGVVPVRVMIALEDRKWLTETKYEMGLFIDHVFLAEDEEGVNPYTYQFNTVGITDGTHVITANIVGYDGEVGTESVLVEVRNRPR